MVDLCQTLPLMCAEDGDGGDQLYGCLVSDVPFGTFDLPIRIVDQDGERAVDAFMTIKMDLVSLLLQKGKDVDIEVDPIGLSSPFHNKPRLLLAQRLVRDPIEENSPKNNHCLSISQ